jgi:hypothetical protein
MVKQGYATMTPGVEWMGGMDLFRVTEEGIQKAISKVERAK